VTARDDRSRAAPLTADRILAAAEEVLRRHGPAKTNVVDVARALGVSHGSVYRHFPSKAALREAVAARFLDDMSKPLEGIDDARRWFETLIATKRRRALEDPELFATYVALAAESGDVIKDHVEHLIQSLTSIVGDERTARAMFIATARFHDPAHAATWGDPHIDEDFESVWELLAQASTRPASSAHSSAAR
jgi:AcrR family transcriptional regulator